MGKTVPPRCLRGQVGFSGALELAQGSGVVGLCQSPGATFPEMSQTPAPSDLSRLMAGKEEQHCGAGKLRIPYVDTMLGRSSQHQASGQGSSGVTTAGKKSKLK